MGWVEELSSEWLEKLISSSMGESLANAQRETPWVDFLSPRPVDDEILPTSWLTAPLLQTEFDGL
jgi:hypothetical protein